MENFQTIKVREVKIQQDDVRISLRAQRRKVSKGFDTIPAPNDGLPEPGMVERYLSDRCKFVVVLHMNKPK